VRLASGRPGVGRVLLDAVPTAVAAGLLGGLRRSGVAVTMLVEVEDLPTIELGLVSGVAGFAVKPVETPTLMAAMMLPGARCWRRRGLLPVPYPGGCFRPVATGGRIVPRSGERPDCAVGADAAMPSNTATWGLDSRARGSSWPWGLAQ
jgi:hypothetical protein